MSFLADPPTCVDATDVNCGGVNVSAPGADANAGPEGATANVPGADANAGPEGANANVPGAGANAGPDSTSAYVPGADASAGPERGKRKRAGSRRERRTGWRQHLHQRLVL